MASLSPYFEEKASKIIIPRYERVFEENKQNTHRDQVVFELKHNHNTLGDLSDEELQSKAYEEIEKTELDVMAPSSYNSNAPSLIQTIPQNPRILIVEGSYEKIETAAFYGLVSKIKPPSDYWSP